MKLQTIGQLAKSTKVSVETIRFYEKQGLIAEPQRTPSGYRQYSSDSIRRIRFIQRAKELGFTLKEIGELLSLKATPGILCADIKAQAATKLENINNKILTLERMKNALMTLIKKCPDAGAVSECPILDALDHDKNH